MEHERIRKFNTRDMYPGQTLDNDMCMLVKAGHRLFLHGQTGLDPTHKLVAPEDAAAQAAQAMQNIKQLLEEAGSSLEHICKVTTYITDRAYRVPVYNTVGRYLWLASARGHRPVRRHCLLSRGHDRFRARRGPGRCRLRSWEYSAP